MPYNATGCQEKSLFDGEKSAQTTCRSAQVLGTVSIQGVLNKNNGTSLLFGLSCKWEKPDRRMEERLMKGYRATAFRFIATPQTNGAETSRKPQRTQAITLLFVRGKCAQFLRFLKSAISPLSFKKKAIYFKIRDKISCSF